MAQKTTVVDTFCQNYVPVVQQKEDFITAPLEVKRRILRNEKLYRTCP